MQYLCFLMPLGRFAGWLNLRLCVAVSVLLLFCGSLFWAKRQDSLSREWFTLKVPGYSSLNCVIILPKPIRRYPVIIYAHGSGGGLFEDGDDLRQMTELGLATISMEYDKTNEGDFAPQFEALLKYIARQKWADTNAIAWVGFSLGANHMFDFVLQHPVQPKLLVQLSGAGLLNGQTNSALLSLHCSILLIHGGTDEVFPVDDTERLASLLSTNGISVVSTIIPNMGHNMWPDREVIFRCVGEYCMTHLSATGSWNNYHSTAEWHAEAPPFWLYCIPVTVWLLGCFVWSQYRKPRPIEKLRLKRNEIALHYIATVLAALALFDTALHLMPPHFLVSRETLAVARKYLVPAKEQADFQFLVSKPIWNGVKLRTLLTHMELANYNRKLVNWQLDDEMYKNYVLSPVITGNVNEQFDWRRPLWEEFYPRIRHENTPEDAAVIVVRHLRERVTILDSTNLTHEVPEIWRRQITDKAGFQIVYLAALRSVGIPARLDSQQQTEFFDGSKWQTAPRPIVESLIKLNF